MRVYHPLKVATRPMCDMAEPMTSMPEYYRFAFDYLATLPLTHLMNFYSPREDLYFFYSPCAAMDGVTYINGYDLWISKSANGDVDNKRCKVVEDSNASTSLSINWVPEYSRKSISDKISYDAKMAAICSWTTRVASEADEKGMIVLRADCFDAGIFAQYSNVENYSIVHNSCMGLYLLHLNTSARSIPEDYCNPADQPFNYFEIVMEDGIYTERVMSKISTIEDSDSELLPSPCVG